MFYTARQLELLDRTYFAWPPGWHTVESSCGKYWARVLIHEGKPKEMIVTPRP